MKNEHQRKAIAILQKIFQHLTLKRTMVYVNQIFFSTLMESINTDTVWVKR